MAVDCCRWLSIAVDYSRWLPIALNGCLLLSMAAYCRGSSRRGLAFEGAVKWDMGNLEVSDQQAAVAAFAAEGLVDTARVSESETQQDTERK